MRLWLMVLVILSLPFAMAQGVGYESGIDAGVEVFEPIIWINTALGGRIVLDDVLNPSYISDFGDLLVEREHNYAFEGEQIIWQVLVMDKNGVELIQDVYMNVDPVQGVGLPSIDANCILVNPQPTTGAAILPGFDARIDEEVITEFDEQTMELYLCVLTVEDGWMDGVNPEFG